MTMTPRVYSVSALAVELGVDRRTLAKHLAAVEPADVRGRSKRWRMRDVFAALKASWSEPKPSAYMDERTRHEAAKRQLAELKLRERRAELIPVVEAEHAIATLLSGVRSQILAVPATTAEELAITERPRECHAIVEAALYEALTAIADAPVEIEAPGGDAPRRDSTRQAGNRPA